MTVSPRSLVVVVPGDPDTRTGGYGYDRRIVAGLRDSGWSIDVVSLAGDFPFPDRAARRAAGALFAALPDNALVMVDGLALGALPDEAIHECDRVRIVALVHHPLALESGLAAETAARLEDSERRALEAARLVVVTSPATAVTLERYGVDAERIAVVEPGTDWAPLAAGGAAVTRLLTVGSLVPRKGHEILIAALARLVDRPWHLTCAGSVERDAETAARVRRALSDHHLEERVTLAGELDEPQLAAEYHRADVFVLATQYEGYGMAVAEAVACGLPVISTPTGGVASLVGGDGGILVPPGDVDALTSALARVLDDARLRAALAAGARHARQRLTSWADAARAMSAALDSVAGRVGPRSESPRR